MTAIRQSFLIKAETNFGKADSNNPWIALPEGTFINTQHNRATTRIQSAGTKMWDAVAYGQLTGAWEMTFILDYEYLEVFYFLFEGFSETPTVNPSAGEVLYQNHSYQKLDYSRVRSFTIRQKMLNRMVGGPTDEMKDTYGCVPRNVSFSKAAGSSQIQVRVTGFFVDEKMVTGDLPYTDYQPYSGKMVEYLCMFVGDSESSTLDNCSYVANTDSLEISIENNAEAIYNTCSPFASNYCEGITNYSFSTTCYSNNPDHYKRRVFTGGATLADSPMSKGLAPLHKIFLVAYSQPARADGGQVVSESDIKTAIATSPRTLTFEITNCVIKSLTWPKGDGSKITDNISSTECQKITMTVKNAGYIADPTKTQDNYSDATLKTYVKHRVTSNPPTQPQSTSTPTVEEPSEPESP